MLIRDCAVMPQTMVVIGGGPAGIAIAARLAEAGHKIVLVEKRLYLGGGYAGRLHTDDGILENTSLHFFSGASTSFLDLVNRMEAWSHLRWVDAFTMSAGGGLEEALEPPSLLPAPFHMLHAVRRMLGLSSEARKTFQRCLWRLIRGGQSLRLKYEESTFAEYLSAEGLSPTALTRLWDSVALTCGNGRADAVSAGSVIQQLQEVLLQNRHGCRIGMLNDEPSSFYDRAEKHLRELGVDVRLGCAVEAIPYDGSRVSGAVTDDGLIRGARFISTVSAQRLHRLCSDTMRRADHRLHHLTDFDTADSVTAHLWFDRSVLHKPFVWLCGSPFQWAVNRGIDRDGWQRLLIDGADVPRMRDLNDRDRLDFVLKSLHDALPATRGLVPQVTQVDCQADQLVVASPRTLRLRPSAMPGGLGRGGIPNLFLAGGWCRTGWPPSLESEVRSAYVAAAGIDPTIDEIGDIPPGLVARRLGLKPGGRIAW